jgi:integrase
MIERLRIERERRDSTFPDCQFVFHRHGKPILNFRKAWDATCTAADLEGPLFHDLRRTAVRNVVRAGIPEKPQWRSPATRPGPSLIATTS